MTKHLFKNILILSLCPLVILHFAFVEHSKVRDSPAVVALRLFRQQGQPKCDSSGSGECFPSRAKCDHVLQVIMYWHHVEGPVACSRHEKLFLAKVKLRQFLETGQGLKL